MLEGEYRHIAEPQVRVTPDSAPVCPSACKCLSAMGWGYVVPLVEVVVVIVSEIKLVLLFPNRFVCQGQVTCYFLAAS
jgi:hypothetical protein